MWAGGSSHLRSTPVRTGGARLAPCLHFKPKAETSSSKFTLSITHFPQVKAAASSKPPWRKGINKTTLKPKQLTRVLGWNNPLDVKLPQLSPGLEFLLPKHMRGLPGETAVRLQLSGDTANRAQTLTGLCRELGRRHHSHPWDSWDCSGESSRQV